MRVRILYIWFVLSGTDRVVFQCISKSQSIRCNGAEGVSVCAVPETERTLNRPQFVKQSLVRTFEKQLDDHEKKYGKTIPDRSLYLEAPWPRNVLQHVLSAYQQRTSFIGSLSRSRTSLNIALSTSNTPNMDRRRSISPHNDYRTTKSAASSITSTTKRGKLIKAQRYSSTSNLKLVSEKISGFSVFRGSDDLRREPIMAYDMSENKRIEEEPRRSLERSKPVHKMPISARNMSPARSHKKLNRQSMSEHMLLEKNEEMLKRSISQQNLKQDIAMEAVVIDMPSIGSKYDTYKSGSTIDSIDIDKLDSDGSTTHFSRWGPVRGSNSYSNQGDIPVSQLSTMNFKTALGTDKNGPPDSMA